MDELQQPGRGRGARRQEEPQRPHSPAWESYRCWEAESPRTEVSHRAVMVRDCHPSTREPESLGEQFKAILGSLKPCLK